MKGLVRATLALSLVGCVWSAEPSAPFRAPLPSGNAEDWPMFRDDVERSGFAEGTTVGSEVSVLWHRPGFNTTAYGAVKGSPSVVGEMLYCGTDTGRFLAARVDDGEVVWQVQLLGTTHGIHGSPAIAGELVFIGAYDGTVYAFGRRSGLLVWRHKVGYQVGSSPAVVPEWGVVYSAHEESPNGGGFVVSLDARTGDEIWRTRTEAHPHSSVAVDVQRQTVFVGDNRGYLYALDARTGRDRWRQKLLEDGKTDIKTTPSVLLDRGLVVFGAWSGKVYALDEGTGDTVWEHETGGRIMASTAYLPSRGIVYAASPSGRLVAISARDGRELWRFDAGVRLDSSPAVSGDGRAVVFGGGDGSIFAVRADDGRLLWRLRLGSKVSGSPTLAGSRVYVTAYKGDLWALATSESARALLPAAPPNQ
jgi:outer membrane protein assembly factor BamB